MNTKKNNQIKICKIQLKSVNNFLSNAAGRWKDKHQEKHNLLTRRGLT